MINKYKMVTINSLHVTKDCSIQSMPHMLIREFTDKIRGYSFHHV
jgi:hypothetical protein